MGLAWDLSINRIFPGRSERDQKRVAEEVN